MLRYADLSHPIENGMTTFEGQPAPVITEYAQRGKVFDEAFRFVAGTRSPPGSTLQMVGSTGTLIDSPYYLSEDGTDVAGLALDRIAGIETVVVDQPFERGRRIEADAFAGLALQGKAVLLRTGWSRHWRSFRYFKGWPYLDRHAASLLVQAQVRIVGIDSLNIDITDDGTRPVHAALLSNDIPIVSHLTGLAAVPAQGARFYAIPLRVPGFSSLPVRAFCTW